MDRDPINGKFLSGNKLGGHTGKQRLTIENWNAVVSPAQIKKLAKKLLEISLHGKGMVQVKAICYVLDRQMGRVPERIEISQEPIQNMGDIRQNLISIYGQDYHTRMREIIAARVLANEK